MLFDVNQLQIRTMYYEIWDKHKESKPLEPLEQQVLNIMLEHPELFSILENPAIYLEKEFSVDAGESNPFLHIALHLAIQEQMQVNQPIGIRHIFEKLCKKLQDPHEALHAIMLEFAYQLSDMQRDQKAFNTKAYMRKLKKL